MEQQVARFGVPLSGSISSDAIDAALGAAWREESAAMDEAPSVRANVLTLVVCVPEADAVDWVFNGLENLSRQHPSRTIVLLPNAPYGPNGLNVWYSAACTRSAEDGRAICNERVVIAARGSAIQHLASLTDQLALTDLPIFLWWAGDLTPQHDALSERLAEMADRLIVDSAVFRNLPISFGRVRWIGQQRHFACAVSDLNWDRLAPWLELVAQFFNSPSLRPYAARLDRVALGYAGDEDYSAQGLLLVGWLASRLRWQFDDAERLIRAPNQPIDLEAKRSAPTNGEGLRRVLLGAADATFRVECQDNNAYALTEAEIKDTPTLRRMVRFGPTHLSALLGIELAFFGRNRVYEDVLAVAVRLAGGAGRQSLHGR